MALLIYYIFMTLKELRKQKKLSQLQASLICNVPLRTYKRLENENKYEKTVKYRYAFELLTLFSKKKDPKIKSVISVVGLGYVGLSNAVLLAQHNKVFAIDLSNTRIETIKKKVPPFNDTELSEYLSQKSLELIPTLNFEEAYKQSEIVVIATPTNYNPDTNKFDTSSVESVICDIKTVNPNAWIVIKSTVGVGFTKYVREKYQYDKILFSPEFLREGKAEDIDVFVVSRQYEFGVFSHINDDQLGVIIARLTLFVEYCQDNKDIILDGRLMGEPVARYLVINNEREVIYHDSVFMKIRDKYGPGIFKR